MFLGAPYAFDVDIWSMGCVMLACLTGLPPFDVINALVNTPHTQVLIFTRRKLSPKYEKGYCLHPILPRGIFRQRVRQFSRASYKL